MKNLPKILLVVLLLIAFSNESVANRDKKLLDLTGIWKFAIGDEMSRAEQGFDDSAWDNIYVPASWEDEGYPGYDGYAWYRTTFEYSPKFDFEDLTLVLGFIDDADEVYVNGNFIGSSGSFPPEYFTSYNSVRKYHLPNFYLYKDRPNTIAIRVFDERLQGGILRGDIGIYTDVYEMLPELNLKGRWNFIDDDNPEYKEQNIDESEWDKIPVPMTWEYAGYTKLNGIAWYRKSFILPEALRNEDLILLLGKIDDIDETYINGKKIGETGNIDHFRGSAFNREEWLMDRTYYIPQGVISDSSVTIAVRVLDLYNNGGIYSGPIGIITKERFREIKRYQSKKKKSFWELLFGD